MIEPDPIQPSGLIPNSSKSPKPGNGSPQTHPAIRFERMPAVRGTLTEFNEIRPEILTDVSGQTLRELSGSSPDLLLGEALYSEKLRLKRQRDNIFTKKRSKRDRALWGQIQRGLIKPPGVSDRGAMLEQVVSHYSEEIGGRFDPRVYRFAVNAVPWLFSWLLNAASVRRFLPWGMTQSLQDRLHILGEVEALQNLSKKGTILLVPTHQSNIDSILIGYVIYLMGLPPFAYGAGLNLFSNPVLSFFMGNLGAYTVDRKKNNEIYKHVLKNYSTRILRENVHSIFFPGGGRSRSGAIESKVKLGLLGTGLEAQIENLREGKANPNVYVVPMVMSYHFVLEAASLIEDYLIEAGKHRLIMTGDESWLPTKVLNFFWKLFSTNTGVTVRIGKPLDIFGNFVDPSDGRSIGPNGTIVDPKRWLTTRGELRHEPQRDREYTRELGNKLVERFHRENTVLSSHLLAFAFFEALRKHYPELDLYRFLRLSTAQRTLPLETFMREAAFYHGKVRAAADQGRLNLSPELLQDTRSWVLDGAKQLGLLHESAVVKIGDSSVWTEDMNLLYYYRNRLAGYGLSVLSDIAKAPGAHDAKGFLA